MNVMGKPPLGLKEKKKRPDFEHMKRVGSMPCVICHQYWLPQMSPTQVHHVIHDRHSTAKSPDTETIPLCEGHHQGLFDTSKIAIHQEPERWRRAYGPDHLYLGWVTDRIRDEDDNTI